MHPFAEMNRVLHPPTPLSPAGSYADASQLQNPECGLPQQGGVASATSCAGEGW